MINGIACFAYFNKIWGIPPREPEPSLGFTVPYETKGTIVCVSNADRELDKWLWIAIVSAFGIAMGGGALSGELPKMLNPDRASN